MPQVQIQRAQPQRIREKEEEEREFIDQVERLDHFSFHFSSTTVALAYIGKGFQVGKNWVVGLELNPNLNNKLQTNRDLTPKYFGL